MKKLLIATLVASCFGCANGTKSLQPQQQEQQEQQQQEQKFRSNTALAVTDTCNATLVVATALTFPFWLPVPIVYGVFTHLTWENNPNDGTKEVLGLFACFSLLPIYAL